MNGTSLDRSVRREILLIVIAIFLLALAVRAVLLLELKNHPTYLFPIGDMKGNHEFAVQVLQGTLPPNTYYKAPLYSYFLAGVYRLFGVNPLYARIVQIVLTSLSPVLTFLIARQFFGLRIGVVSGLLAAVYWTFLFFSTELLDTALACLFYLLLAYLLVVLDDRHWWKWSLCGIVLGLGAITRPNILVFAPMLAVVVTVVTLVKGRKGDARDDEFATPDDKAVNHSMGLTTSTTSATPNVQPVARSPAWRCALVNVIALTVGCCAAVLPVTLRNRIAGGEWVLIGAYGGLNLYVANNPDSDSKDGPLLIDESLFTVPMRVDPNAQEPWARNCLNYLLACRLAESKLGRKPKPGEFATILSGMAKDFLRDHPGWFVRHAIKRFCWLFNRYEFQSNRDLQEFSEDWGVLRGTRYLHFGVICPLAIIGLAMALVRAELRTTSMLYYWVMLGSLALPAILFIINSRFRTPVVHLLIPFAAFGLVEIVGLFRPGVAWARRLTVAAGLVSLLLFSNSNLFDYWSHRRAHLLSMYVDACNRTGRSQLIDEAYNKFEQAISEEMDDPRPSNPNMMLRYGRHMTRLFVHYLQRKNVPKALKYGWLMVQREPIQPEVVVAYFDLLLRTNDRRRAEEVLNVLTDRCGMEDRSILAGCLLRFGQQYLNRSALAEAVKLYRGLVEREPANLAWHMGLNNAKTAFAELRPMTSSAAATPPSIGKEASR